MGRQRSKHHWMASLRRTAMLTRGKFCNHQFLCAYDKNPAKKKKKKQPQIFPRMTEKNEVSCSPQWRWCVELVWETFWRSLPVPQFSPETHHITTHLQLLIILSKKKNKNKRVKRDAAINTFDVAASDRFSILADKWLLASSGFNSWAEKKWWHELWWRTTKWEPGSGLGGLQRTSSVRAPSAGLWPFLNMPLKILFSCQAEEKQSVKMILFVHLLVTALLTGWWIIHWNLIWSLP